MLDITEHLGPDAPRAQTLDRQIELEETLTDLDKDHDGAVFGPFHTPATDLKSWRLQSKTDDRVDKVQDPEANDSAAHCKLARDTVCSLLQTVCQQI